VAKKGKRAVDISIAHEERKRGAYMFLKNFESALNSELPPPAELRTLIRKTTLESKTDSGRDYLRLPESAFLNLFAIPALHKFISNQSGMNSLKASEVLLSEYKRLRPRYCSGPPIRTMKHPFRKVMGVKPSTIMQQWMSGRDNALTQSSPDICIRAPFPFTILFEGKYFEKGGPEKAATELVTAIYQAFFYRGLPYVASRNGGPTWDYEFACMLASDTSEQGSLRGAWERIPSAVKKGFWDGANIYIMIVRGKTT
jgi:hypothetical protein